MALTIGVRRYSSSADLRALCADPHFLRVLHDALGRIRNDGERQRAEARGRAKLKKWVTKDTKYLIPFGAKGQGKSFPSYETAVTWLLYKTQKTFADNQQLESRLAEEVHGNAKIRRLIFEFLRGPLAAWWRGLNANLRGTIGGKTGRYAHFYSKLFCNRTIKEGFEYFGVGSAGLFSKTVTEANLSISEAAAFISDVALASKKECRIAGRHMGGIDNLRYNLTEVDQKTRHALDAAFNVLSDAGAGIFAENRYQDLIPAIKDFLSVLERLRRTPQYNDAVATLFQQIVGVIRENVENDDYLVTVAPQNLKILNEGRILSREAGACRTAEQQLAFIGKAAVDNYLTSPRQGAETVAELKGNLQQQLAADSNKTPDLLKGQYPELYKKVRQLGENNARRMEYNVDPDHEWTKFMINHDAVVGAGPSGTTSFTLGLVELACVTSTTENQRMAAYSVAMALFSFWQRKKKLLKYQSTVHTWNEVCAALDHHRGANYRVRDQFLEVSDTGKLNDDAGCDLYRYPRSFNNVDGRPEYGAAGTTFADLFGE